MNILSAAPRPPAELLLRAAHVLDPRADLDGAHDVLIRDGRIAELSAPGTLEAPAGAEVIDAEGRHLFPAFVDPHVHLRTPGQEHKEDLDTGTRAAAAGGYCAVVAMPNTDPVIDHPALLRGLVDAAAREARIPVGFMAAISQGLVGEHLTDMSALRSAGAIGFTDDGKPVASAGLLRHALRNQILCGGFVALHEEDPALSLDGVMHEGTVSVELGLAGIPSISESTMIARDAQIAEAERGRVHFQHLSARRSVEALAEARSRGVLASGEVTPHHLLLTDESVRSLDSSFKMNPPLRGEDDRAALLEGLRNGTIEFIATDHAPHSRDEKNVPFEQAPMGTTGLESSFAMLYTELVLPGAIELELLIERLTAAAALIDIETPSIEPGKAANACLIDLAAQWRIGEAGYESRSSNCCFAGHEVNGRVLMTIADGAVAYRERAFAVSAA
ncbi:MAG TPA: dihydroorotase [Solirubrobacteraceae bacterium]|jgi:dihydroorotase|nr:dihydroorotase [Solirubrobacteraceae bacterium]